ncbi:MAG: PAS domain S-box protein [Nitriliruptorales bacterium]|nr:PAS domain S-box protein [Nitriliruptorales bacterium]
MANFGSPRARRPRWSVATVVGTYFVVGLAWILVTALLVAPVSGWLDLSPQLVEVLKGLLFVLVTATVLYASLRHWETAFVASEMRSRAIVSSSDAAIVGTDAAGRITTWNPAAERLYGWMQSEVTGSSIVDVTGDRRIERSGVELGHRRYTTRHQTADGSWVDVAVTVSPLNHHEGQNAGSAVIVRDVSEQVRRRQELARSERRFRKLAEQTAGVVYRIAFTPEPRIDYFSPQAEEVFGYPPEVYYADPDLMYRQVHPDDRHKLAFLGKDDPREGTAESGVSVFRFRHGDGRWIWLEDHHTPESDETGRVVADQGIAFDITARRQEEQARAAALEHEREAAEQLKRTVAAHRTFLRNVSHEVRTPLTSVVGVAETLQARLGDLGSGQQEQLLDRLQRNSLRLWRLFEDLLDLDRLSRGAGELDLEDDVDLAQVCEQLIAELDAGEHSIRCHVPPTSLRLDRPKIERAIDNLLRNAVKHTPSGTRITVDLQRAEDHVDLTVTDDGPGIPAALVPTIFDAFRQGPDASEDPTPGAGIGLAIAREFARVHGGDLSYEPGEPGGSCFRLHLPVSPSTVS